MIEERVVPYWEIDEQANILQRMVSAVKKESAETAKIYDALKPPKVKKCWPRKDELVPPVVSPERYIDF